MNLIFYLFYPYRLQHRFRGSAADNSVQNLALYAIVLFQ